jgi:AraC family transcriptional regulator, arabinose operon regulatory protein
MQKRSPREQFRNRTLSSFVLIYAIRGTATYFDPTGEPHPVRAGDAVQMHANQSHGLQPGADGQWAEAYLMIDGTSAEAITRLRAIDPSRMMLRPGVDLSIVDLFDRLLDELLTASDDRMPLMVSRVHEILATILLRDRRDDGSTHARMVQEACRRISESPADKPNLQPLLDEHGISYERFRKIFRAQTGLSPNDYRIRRRMDLARAMLVQQRSSIKQIAYTLGYPDPFSFSRQFKQVVGVSPKHFTRAGT